MSKFLKGLEREQHGIETIEYAVMTALIIGALVLAVGVLTAAVSGRFDGIMALISGTS